MGVGALHEYNIPECVRAGGRASGERRRRRRRQDWTARALCCIAATSHARLPRATSSRRPRSPYRVYCPRLRAKLAIIVDQLLHGYDEEEICYGLRMCSWMHVHVWKPGKPTSIKLSRGFGLAATVDETVTMLNG